MGLACTNVRLLAITAHKASCTQQLSMASLHEMLLAKEQIHLSEEYDAKRQQKNVVYYSNGQYNKMNYEYLMGYDNYSAIISGKKPLKEENSMILTDYKGQVVMSDAYANAIVSVLGPGIVANTGKGKTFSTDNIPAILAKIVPGFTAKQFKDVIDGETIDSNFDVNVHNSLTGDDTGVDKFVDNSKEVTSQIQKIVDFYLPIFSAAATNGWTTEYNADMKTNSDYITDAISSGTFQLASVNDTGNYEPDMPLEYFITANLVYTQNDSAKLAQIDAEFNRQRDILTEKENQNQQKKLMLSTKLEAYNTEIESLRSMLQDAVSVFNWGGK